MQMSVAVSTAGTPAAPPLEVRHECSETGCLLTRLCLGVEGWGWCWGMVDGRCRLGMEVEGCSGGLEVDTGGGGWGWRLKAAVEDRGWRWILDLGDGA